MDCGCCTATCHCDDGYCRVRHLSASRANGHRDDDGRKESARHFAYWQQRRLQRLQRRLPDARGKVLGDIHPACQEFPSNRLKKLALQDPCRSEDHLYRAAGRFDWQPRRQRPRAMQRKTWTTTCWAREAMRTVRPAGRLNGWPHGWVDFRGPVGCLPSWAGESNTKGRVDAQHPSDAIYLLDYDGDPTTSCSCQD